MGILDELLPGVTTAALQTILAKPVDERPDEGLFYEFKSEFTPSHVGKSVSAFANAQGGFLIFGAEAVDGRLHALPGLDPAPEWPRLVANNIIGHVSPLPSWEPTVVASPTQPSRVVLVVKVPASSRAPHIMTTSGRIYLRSPGGTSDPVKDRATLDLLVRRGLRSEQAVLRRAETLLAPTAIKDPVSRFLAKIEWQFAVASVPLPLGSTPQADLLTRSGYLEAPHLFDPPGQVLKGGTVEGMVEDGVRLSFGNLDVTVFSDGTMHAFWRHGGKLSPVPHIARLLAELLVAQTRLTLPVREARVFVQLHSGGGVRLSESFDEHSPGRTAPAPVRWEHVFESVAFGDGLSRNVNALARRLWRVAGKEAFEPG